MFQSIIREVDSAFSIIPALHSFVDMITRTAFCAYREGKNDYYEVAQRLIRLLSSKVSISMSIIDDLYNPLSILNDFKALLKRYIFNPLKVFEALLTPVFFVLQGLQYLKTIAEFRLSVPIPYLTFKIKW